MQDLDLLSDFQVTDDPPVTSNTGNVSSGVTAVTTMDASASHDLMSSELMDDDLGPEDMMSSEDDRFFDGAADMDFTEEELPAPSMMMPQQTVSTVLSTNSMTVTTGIQQLGNVAVPSATSMNTYSKHQPVIASSQTLTEFCTSIRPPVIPGPTVTGSVNPLSITLSPQQTAKTINLNTMTIQRSNFQGMRSLNTNPSSQQSMAAKKLPQSSAPLPIQVASSAGHSTQNTYKLVIPSSQQQSVGQQQQQIFIQPSSGQVNLQPQTLKSPVTNITTNAAGQQVVFLSPVKTEKGVNKTPTVGQLKTIAPAPSIASQSQPNFKVITAKDGQVIKGAGGQPLQVIRLVSSTAGQQKTLTSLRTIAPSPSGKTVTLIPTSKGTAGTTGTHGGNSGGATVLTGAAATQFLQRNTSASVSGGSSPQVIMLPANLLSQAGLTLNNKTGQLQSNNNQGIKIHVHEGKRPFVPIAPSPSSSSHSMHPSSKEVLQGLNVTTASRQIHSHSVNGSTVQVKKEPIESSGGDASKRKPCNCSKSQCLKLYCDCFANGEFCKNCNCSNCFNNLDHEEDREKAIRQCLERNPVAFHPKIGKGKMTGDLTERRHRKGCNCRRSGCLKNYCEVSVLSEQLNI